MAKTARKSPKVRSSRSAKRKTADLALRGRRASDIKGGRLRKQTIG
jgi:hypothetical protein